MQMLAAALVLCLLLSSLAVAQGALPAPVDLPAPQPAVEAPGEAYTPPLSDAAPPAGVPVIYEYTHEAGPDESCFIVGEGFSEKSEAVVWGRDARNAGGAQFKCKVHFFSPSYLTVTIPDGAYDGPFLLWVSNEAGWSRPVRLNVPEVWSCRQPAQPGGALHCYGTSLGAPVTGVLAQPGKPGRWVTLESENGRSVVGNLPDDLAEGTYRLWLHREVGGQHGWSDPVAVKVAKPTAPPAATKQIAAPAAGQPSADMQQAVDQLGAAGGGRLELAAGTYSVRGTIKVPAGVHVHGNSETVLQMVHGQPTDLKFPTSSVWGQGVGGIHTVGDEMEYRLTVPAAGKWQVWLRYATDMAPWGQDGVSGKHSLRVDDGAPVPLENLPNTGSFGTFKWSRAAELDLTAGEHRLTWRNDKGGGINPDAFVFALDPDWQPDEKAFPEPSDKLIVQQAEAVVRFASKDGSLPGGAAPAVWLAGDGASISEVTIVGNPQVATGILVQSDQPLRWIRGNTVHECVVRDLLGRGSNSGVSLVRAEGAVINSNQLEARAPLLLQGIRQCELSSNWLPPIRRYGDPALAAILGSQDTIEECVIENNKVASPPGSEAGGPEVMRLIWLSTGHGSITRNWIAGNGVAPRSQAGAMRFGGVAGREQNVGEMILFEANHRTMFHGQPVAADATSVTLPKTVPETPEERLGSVKREQLAHDAAGNETPFWPPDVDDGTAEPPIHQYYVTVMKGVGQGQTRRVVKREGEKLLLEAPWRVPPTKDSAIVIGTGYYRNLIVDNYTPDGMTGIQLWISCFENIASGNTIERMRRPAFYLYSNATTLSSSMPRTWNRGLSPLFFNLIEGNRTDECSAGALVTSGEAPNLPVEFPRALGNVLRHNSFIRNRTEGVIITARDIKAGDTSPAIEGTVTEFNVVRDAPVGYHSGLQSDYALFRRNHAYFWTPMNNSPDPYVAFQVDRPQAQVVIEENTVEEKVGELKPKDVVEVKKPE
ncbi:MAG: hypothetical protein KKI08_00675 [Armatimonadetes bacterium]|nr:hypothetical protein [Armatimonadota bacterium]